MFQGAAAFFNDAVAGTVVEVKAAPALLHGLKLLNAAGVQAYLQVFDSPAASVVLGTTAPKFAVRLGVGESLVMPLDVPIQFLAGLSLAGTTTPTGNTGASISVTGWLE